MVSVHVAAIVAAFVGITVSLASYLSLRESERDAEERRLRELPALTNGRRPRDLGRWQ